MSEAAAVTPRTAFRGSIFAEPTHGWPRTNQPYGGKRLRLRAEPAKNARAPGNEREHISASKDRQQDAADQATDPQLPMDSTSATLPFLTRHFHLARCGPTPM